MQGLERAARTIIQAVLSARLAADLRCSAQRLCIRCLILTCVCWRRQVLPSKSQSARSAQSAHPLDVLKVLALLHKLLVQLVVLAIGQRPLGLLQQLLGCHLSKALHPVLRQKLQWHNMLSPQSPSLVKICRSDQDRRAGSALVGVRLGCNRGWKLHLAQIVQLDIQVLHELHNMAPGLLLPCTHRGWLSTKHLPTMLLALRSAERRVCECWVSCSLTIDPVSGHVVLLQGALDDVWPLARACRERDLCEGLLSAPLDEVDGLVCSAQDLSNTRNTSLSQTGLVSVGSWGKWVCLSLMRRDCDIRMRVLRSEGAASF